MADRPSPSQLWRQFGHQRMVDRRQADRLAAAVLMVVAVVTRMHVGVHETSMQELHSASVLVLSIIVLLWAEELVGPEYSAVRAAVVFLLKMAAATAPLFRLHALSLLHPEGPEALLKAPSALLRILVADHTALLLLLGLSMPQSIVADVVAQLAFLWMLSFQTPHLCDTPFMHESAKGSPWLRLLANKKACTRLVSSTQLVLGVGFPLLLSVQREAADGVRFAEHHGIPDTNTRLRIYRRLHAATRSRWPWLGAALIVLHAVWAAAVWLRYAAHSA